MRKQFFVKKAIAIVVFVFAFIVGLSFAVMALWNNILVDVLHVGTITFWQALGIFLLSRILFGGFPGKPGWAGRGHNRREMEEMRNKWFNMSPEERQHFKQNLRGRFRGCQPPATPESPASEQSAV